MYIRDPDRADALQPPKFIADRLKRSGARGSGVGIWEFVIAVTLVGFVFVVIQAATTVVEFVRSSAKKATVMVSGKMFGNGGGAGPFDRGETMRILGFRVGEDGKTLDQFNKDATPGRIAAAIKEFGATLDRLEPGDKGTAIAYFKAFLVASDTSHFATSTIPDEELVLEELRKYLTESSWFGMGLGRLSFTTCFRLRHVLWGDQGDSSFVGEPVVHRRALQGRTESMSYNKTFFGPPSGRAALVALSRKFSTFSKAFQDQLPVSVLRGHFIVGIRYPFRFHRLQEFVRQKLPDVELNARVNKRLGILTGLLEPSIPHEYFFKPVTLKSILKNTGNKW